MKKTLLLLATAMLSISSAFAQWAEPEMPTTGSEVISGHKYQIKNVAATEETNEEACFLAGGVAWYTWATSTALTSQDAALTFTVTETEQGWTFQNVADSKYTFISGHSPASKQTVYNEEKKEDEVVRIVNHGEMHVDMKNQAADLKYFGIQKAGDYYRVYAAKANTAFSIPVYAEDDTEGTTPLLFWGWKTNNDEADEANIYGPFQTAVYGTVDPAAGFGCDWEFIDISIYEARQALYALYDEAEENDVDLSAATKVYEDPNATLEELNAAIDKVKHDIAAAKNNEVLDGATMDNPIDATDLIVNNDFSAGNISGWTCTFVSGKSAQNIGYQKASYENTAYKYENHNFEEVYPNCKQFIEAWSSNDNKYKFNGRDYATIGDATLEQTLFSLPQGLYKLSCDAIATQQYNSAVGANVTGVQLFATDLGEGGLDNYKNIASADKIPEHIEFTFATTGGDVRLGMRTIDCTANWIAADNFELVYYGPIDDDPAKAVLNQVIANYEAQYIENDVYAYSETMDAFKAALQAAKDATDNYNEYQDALDKAANDLSASIASYATLLKNIETAGIRVEELDGTEWTELASLLSEFMDELNEHYENGDYTTAQIDSVAITIEEMIADYVSENLQPGNDVTILLKNPGFTSDFSGWTSTGAGVEWQKNHGNGENLLDVNVERPEDEDGLAERWHGAFTLSQTIKNLPAGLYELTCQGFNRHDDGVNDKFAELYAVLPDGSTQTAHFADINAYATEDMLYENEEGDEHWRSDAYNEELEKYIPNSMTGAAWHFMNKSNGEDYDYISRFDIVLTEKGDLTVGARCTDTHQWVIFDNFRIVYKGTEGNIYEKPILSLQEQAKFYANTVTDPMGKEIDDAIAAGDDAISSGDEETCKAAMETLQNVITRADENLDLQKKAQTYYDKINALDDMITEMEDDDLSDKLVEFIDVIDEKKYMEYTNEELTAFCNEADSFIVKVNDLYVAWQQESKYAKIAKEVAGASDDDPAELTEFLANPDLEEAGSTRGQDPAGWTLDLTQYTNRGYQDNKVYTGAAIELNGEEYTPTCEHFIEVWKSGNEPIYGDIYQKIMLPAGTYKLAADVITTNGEQIEGCYLYAGDSHIVVRSDEANIPKHYELIFKVAEDRTIVQLGINCSSTSNASWLGADNFTLTAYGTNSNIEENGEENAISNITAESLKTIFDLTGRKVSQAKKGLYIIGGKKIVVK